MNRKENNVGKERTVGKCVRRDIHNWGKVNRKGLRDTALGRSVNICAMLVNA